MQFLKKFLLALIAPILTILLYSAATNFAFVKVAGNPENIKQTLSDSGIYSGVVDGLINESGNVGGSAGTVSLKDTPVKMAAKQTFDGKFIQAKTEMVIDSVYRWLDGTTPTPDFNIDLTATRAEFAKNAGAAVATQLSALPACPAGTNAQTFDADNATCLPAGVNPTTEGAKVEQKINSGEGFLDHPVITAASIKSDGGKPVFEGNLKNAPDAYQAAKAAPYFMAVLALFLAVAVIFLSATKRKGLRKIGVMLLIAGVFLLGAGYGINWGVNKQIPKHLKLNNAVLKDSVVKLSKDVGGQIGQSYYIFGGAYALIGLGLVLGTAFIGKKPVGKDDLEGEGKTKEDRIDIKEPVQATKLADDPAKKPITAKTKTATAPRTAAKSVAKPAPKKIIIQ